MREIHIITPVKDSIDLTLQTIKSVLASDMTIPYHYYVYNDFSTPENTARLQKASEEMGFELIHLADLTDHPSPNYLLILQMAQQKAIESEAGLLIVESDVVVKKNTLQKYGKWYNKYISVSKGGRLCRKKLSCFTSFMKMTISFAFAFQKI